MKQLSEMEPMEFHRLANLFPLTEGVEFEVLVEDIRRNGLREQITLYEGVILDGRNRFRACERAGVQPQFTEYSGTDPLGFVISGNVRRRHLTDSQRAMAAARAETTRHGGDRKSADRDANWHLDREAAAKAFGARPRTIARAAAVLATGVPELVVAVDQGKVKVSKAANIARWTPDEQRAWLVDPKGVQAKARENQPRSSACHLPVFVSADNGIKAPVGWYLRGLAVGLDWQAMRGPQGEQLPLEAAALFEPMIEHREKLVLNDRLAAAFVQAFGLEALRSFIGLGLKSASDWAEVGPLILDRLLASDSAPATDYVAIRERRASLNPRRAEGRKARRYNGSDDECWTTDENYCRVQYVGEDLDDLVTDHAYSHVMRKANQPAREAAQRKIEAAAKEAKRNRRERRLPPVH